MKVLVTYATRHGTTRGIAERIGEVLQRRGFEVTCKPAEQAGSVDAYDGVVIGGAAYAGHWMKEASAFVRKHRAQLARRPVWLFTCGPTGVEPDEAKRAEILRSSIPREFAEVAAAIGPRDQKVFYGAYDPGAAPVGIAEGLFARILTVAPKIRESIPAGDFRDWSDIEAWADRIARDLNPAELGALA